ncbi:MAG TPA: iron-containing alcohol dehydrogenase [Opitutaceae bacterium]
MQPTFSFPTPILFAPEARGELREQLGALGSRRPLVVTDAGLAGTRAFDLMSGCLTGSGAQICSQVRANPTDEDVEAVFRVFDEKGCDAVIGFGGGSALDVAKAIRLRIKHPAASLAEFNPSADWRGLVPFIAIPTTSGTGSEVGRSAVIIIDQRKRVLFHPALLANLVILDPELTLDLPPGLTAATGADALSHCIESYTSPVFHPLCDGIALEGIHLIAEALPRAVSHGRNLEARGRMQVAAAMGGIAFQKDLGATHSLAHPLSSLCGVHHGLANALCLPAVMEFNARRKPGLYRRVGIALGLNSPDDAAVIGAVRRLLEGIGIKPGLRAHGVDESRIDALADQALADGCHVTNPVPVTRADLRLLYVQAL